MSCPPHFLSVFHVFSPQYYHSIHLLFMMILDGIQQQEKVDLEIEVDLLLFSVHGSLLATANQATFADKRMMDAPLDLAEMT